jgi:two-component system, chemotaxis family, protein-glutamate methylesterase/glutaminase
VTHKNEKNKKYKAIVIGASAGGMDAIRKILNQLPVPSKMAVIIVQHISPRSENYWLKILAKACKMDVKEAEEKETIKNDTVYVAPPGYHLLVEKSFDLSLSSDEQVNYSRPSIDVLFETAADAYKDALIGIVLTGANKDGSEGLKKIKLNGGLTIVEDPQSAEVNTMPLAAAKIAEPHHILPLEKIAELLISIIEHK